MRCDLNSVDALYHRSPVPPSTLSADDLGFKDDADRAPHPAIPHEQPAIIINALDLLSSLQQAQ